MTSIKKQFLNAALSVFVLTVLLVSGRIAAAQTDVVEIERDGSALAAMLRPLPDRDIVDTALIFTNLRGGTAVVTCTAFGPQGNTLGRYRVRVPESGLRFILASDISSGGDFVGSARCLSIGDVTGSAYLTGPQVTDMRVRHQRGPQGGWITFPVVATY